MDAHPQLVCQSSNFDSLTLTWSGRARRYKVEYRRVNEEWGPNPRTKYCNCGAPSIEIISGLSPSSAYVFRLECANEYGDFAGPGQEYTFHTRESSSCCVVS